MYSCHLEGPERAQVITDEADAGEEPWRPLLSKEGADPSTSTFRDGPQVLVVPGGCWNCLGSIALNRAFWH